MYRIGTTSYILPDDLVPNARYLASKVQDIELILFEDDHGPGNMPEKKAVKELRQISEACGISYTVHLPLDLRWGADDGSEHVSMRLARRVIERTRPLHPYAYVAHLDRRSLDPAASRAELQRWEDQAARALEQAAGWAGGPAYLAVENLEGFPPEVNMKVLEKIPAGLCIDIGHLWRDGHDAGPYLEKYLKMASVVHIHGVGEHDHQSLKETPREILGKTIRQLKSSGFNGVLTLEVFNEDDLKGSLKALREVEEME